MAARIVAAIGRGVRRVSIDTRTLAPATVRRDSRRTVRRRGFRGAAIDAGAAGVVVRAAGRAGGVASAARVVDRGRRHDGGAAGAGARDSAASGTKVVAITGSAGKTTTKEVTSEFLAARYRVVRNRGNFNNHIGLPLSLIELRQRPEIAVVELGMNHAGEISTLVRVAEPDVRVWTNVGEAHSASSRRSTRSPTRRPRSSKGAASDAARRQRRRRPDRARRARSPAAW
jgi:UDP-N-acetylmuramoyl-tripeptide--D-alanyl-D-alanine ligase